MRRVLRFLGVCPPKVGCYKEFKNGQWVCQRCGC
jgi:hypothetical protein